MAEQTQTGSFFRGTFGYPVRFELGISLAGVTGIKLTIEQPNSATVSHDLPMPASIIDEAAGIIQHILVEGDIKKSGTYQFVLQINTGITKRLNVNGTFEVN